MKSKMKSAFALIAVALMIMVAVVPMALVFTEDSDATIKSDPSEPSEAENQITLVVNVLDAKGTADNSKYVKIAYGSYTQIKKPTAGTATFTICEKTVSSVSITYGTEAGVADTEYGTVTLSSLVANQTYNATLQKGKATATLTFKDATGNLTLNENYLTSLSGTYKVYTTNNNTGTLLGSGPLVVDTENYTATISYTYNSSAYVCVETLSSNLTLTVDTTSTAMNWQSVTGGTATIKVKESQIVITPQTTSSVYSVKITSATLSDSSTIQILDDTMGCKFVDNALTAETAELFAIVPATSAPTLGLTLSADNQNYTIENLGTIAAAMSWTVAGAFFGKAAMEANYVQGGTLSAEIWGEGTSALGTISSVTVDSDGYFFKFLTTEQQALAATGYKNARFYSDGVTFQPADFWATTYGAAPQTVVIPSTGYSLVAGSLKLGTTDTTINDVTLVVNGPKTFGSLLTNFNGTSGAYSFYAVTGVKATILMTGAALSGDVSVTPGAGSTGGTLRMSTQTIKVTVQDALGSNIGTTDTTTDITSVKLYESDGKTVVATLAYDNTAASVTYKKYTATIRADQPLTGCLYIIAKSVSGKYNFEESYLYADDTVCKATNAQYKIKIVDSEGNVVPATANHLNYAVAKAYKNSEGAIIAEYSESTAAGVSGNYFTFYAEASEMAVSESDLNTTPKDVVVAVVGQTTTTWTTYNMKDVYVLTAVKGIATISGNADSYTGTLVKYASTTTFKAPIAGATVMFYKESTLTNLLDIVTTDSDGKFTVTSNTKITADNYFKFVKTGFAFAEKNQVSLTATQYKPTTDSYEIMIEDADGAAFLPTGTLKIGGGNAATPGLFTYTLVQNLAKDTEYTVTLQDANTKNIRTFAKYTVTSDDIKSGIITLTTKERTYTIYGEDAAEKPIALTQPTFYVKSGESYSAADFNGSATIGVITPVTGTIGVYTVPLTDLELGQEYAFIPAASGSYIFADVPFYVEFDDYEATATSLYTEIYFGIADATGVPLAFTGITATELKVTDGVNKITVTPVASIDSVKFFGSPLVSYKTVDYTWTVATAAGNYTVGIGSEIEEGVVETAEQTVTFVAVDAMGTPISLANADIVVYEADGTQVATYNDQAFSNAGQLSVIAINDVTYFYTLTDDANVYHFDESTDGIFAANETSFKPSFVTANGVDLTDDIVADKFIKAYDAAGNVIAQANTVASVGATLVVDPEELAYMKAEAGVVLGYTFDDTIIGAFVANESLITGSVPWSGKTVDQDVYLDFYLEGNLVYEDVAPFVEKSDYWAIIDLSGMVINGVVFDSIVASYYEGGVEVASSTVDPFTSVNNIVSPIIETYEAVLLPPSVLIASHVDIDQIGDVVTVTADANFMIADDEGVYTDGQYTYTFAGWYVDNQKVSTSPVYTFELTDNVVISPQYTVTYEKTSDANDKQTPQPQPVQPDNSIDTNVLIIGICAVIVALIAVVYAVIKKE